jgi:hypothetical protein
VPIGKGDDLKGSVGDKIEAKGGKCRITKPQKSISTVYNKAGDGSHITATKAVGKEYTFAGKGSKSTLKAEQRMLKDYGGKKGDWSHSRQNMEFNISGKTQVGDVHYFYEPSICYVEPRVKFW